MKAHTTLETVRPKNPLAAVPPKPLSPAITERSPAASKAARLDTTAKPDDSAQFRADMLRRREEPFDLAWGHGGLND
jgi:hypothetical protein